MKPEIISIVIAGVGMVFGGLNAWMTLRLQTAISELKLSQAELRRDVMDEVERKYVRKDVLYKRHAEAM